MQERKDDKPPGVENPPILISDLDAGNIDPHYPGDMIFAQNSVPFDFDGEHLIFMQYEA